jgi:hypothetical protein
MFGRKRYGGAQSYPFSNTGYGGKRDVGIWDTLVEVWRFLVECVLGRRRQVTMLAKPNGFDATIFCHPGDRNRIFCGLAGRGHESDLHGATSVNPVNPYWSLGPTKMYSTMP